MQFQQHLKRKSKPINPGLPVSSPPRSCVMISPTKSDVARCLLGTNVPSWESWVWVQGGNYSGCWRFSALPGFSLTFPTPTHSHTGFRVMEEIAQSTVQAGVGFDSPHPLAVTCRLSMYSLSCHVDRQANEKMPGKVQLLCITTHELSAQ